METAEINLRNIATIYIFHADKVLLIKKTHSRMFTNPDTVLWCGIGGHFEHEELNNPKSCVIRELFEETALKESDIKNLTLKYITLRKKETEIRQQYIYFAYLANTGAILRECDEGELHWINIDDLPNLEMAYNNAQCLNHYFKTGRSNQKDNYIYVCATEASGDDNLPHVGFMRLQDFYTAY